MGRHLETWKKKKKRCFVENRGSRREGDREKVNKLLIRLGGSKRGKELPVVGSVSSYN